MARPKPPVLTVTCPVCNREFKTTNAMKRYCDMTCREVARQRRKYAHRCRRKAADKLQQTEDELLTHGGTYMEEKRITRGKAIRLKCLDCCCGNSAEVRRCPATHCPLWRYRMGNEQKGVESHSNEE